MGSPPPVETPRNLQAGFDIIMAAAANLATSESTRYPACSVGLIRIIPHSLHHSFNM